MSDDKKNQELIRQFTDPVFLVNYQSELVACNLAFKQHPALSQSVAELLVKISPLLQGEQERVFWSPQNQHLILTVLPMAQKLWLIKCHPARSSSLSQRYHNIITAIDQLSEAMLICNVTNNIELVNKPIKRLFPYILLDSCQGMHILTFARQVLQHLKPNSPRKTAAVLRWLKLKIQRKQPCQLRFTNSDGCYIEYRDRITDSGERIGLLIDESSFHALHEQLELAYEHATNLSKAKSSFMAAMSHEVKTPLNAIIGMLDLCMQDPAMAANEFLGRIQSNADRLLHLINDVLDFTKFEAEKVELSLVPVNIRSLCEQLMESLSGQAKLNNTQITLYLDPTLPQIVQVDDIRLSQVLNNLLNNGLKFTTNYQPSLYLTITKLASPGFIRFSVRDNGIGISHDQQRNIFNDFMQASPNIHREFGGSGLGLSICQKICQLMGCVLRIESELGEGAHFYFDLPILLTGQTDIERFDLSLAKKVKLFTNDPPFYDLLVRYASCFGFDCVLIDTLPRTLNDREYLFYAPHNINAQSEISLLPSVHTAILCNTNAGSACDTFIPIQRTPLKLIELMTFIGVIKKPQTISHVGNILHTHCQTRTLRALVIEDNQDNMFVLRKQFEVMNINASFATDPNDAIIYFEQQRFDVIISDYQMPGMSGAKLIKTLRQLEKQQQRKVAFMLVLTADKTQHCYQNCMSVGVNEVVLKPLTLNALAKILYKITTTLDNPPLNHLSDKDFTSNSFIESCPTDFIFIEQDISKSPQHHKKDAKQSTDFTVLAQCLGDIKIADRKEFLQQYAHNLLKINKEMNRATTQKHWNTLQRLAHNLQGSALIVGAAGLSGKCEELEQLLNNRSGVKEQAIITLWLQTELGIGQVYKDLQTQLRETNA
ncbi:MAG: two-component system sensor histidine kinase BarA [Paraglaciecola sp.]